MLADGDFAGEGAIRRSVINIVARHAGGGARVPVQHHASGGGAVKTGETCKRDEQGIKFFFHACPFASGMPDEYFGNE